MVHECLRNAVDWESQTVLVPRTTAFRMRADEVLGMGSEQTRWVQYMVQRMIHFMLFLLLSNRDDFHSTNVIEGIPILRHAHHRYPSVLY